MALQQDMSETYDESTPNLTDQEWPIAKCQYSPPRAINQYASRALPPRPRSSSSKYDSGEDGSRQNTPRRAPSHTDAGSDYGINSFGGTVDEEAMEMVGHPQIATVVHSQANGRLALVSPRPRRPDSKLLSIWSTGDELVSPIDTPGTASWHTHIVSPLSEFSPGRASSAQYESWFDDTSSDEGEPSSPTNRARKKNQFAGHAFVGASQSQLRKMSHRHSDPGSPLNPDLDSGWLGEPGPDVGGSRRLGDTPGRQMVQPQVHTQSTHSGDGQRLSQNSNMSTGEPKAFFAVSKIGAFSSNRSRASQRPAPPPLHLGERSDQHDHMPPPRPNSVSSQRSEFRTNEPSAKLQRRRSRLANLGTSLRPLTPNRHRPPPGFTEVLSQLDKQGAVSPVPRVKNVLSRAKRGLGISSDESKKEKGREGFKRQVRHAEK
ncbi:hypothetical protein SAMD00023353_0202480 [Rosellinia necatrix]|uniref:Uncharacterized protein n=1 Tax=Rosellinia necatrix TaxID=77044 RepID=A0A1S7UJG0_ROSNE|nr:hypothetical protein SAMD00023353_0202480 [Rosellinia necatrix]